MMFAQTNPLQKTFIFQNESNNQSQGLQVSIPEDSEQIDIQNVIQMYKLKHSITEMLMFKIYDPLTNLFVSLDVHKPLTREFVYTPVIMLKYSEVHESSESESMGSSKAQSVTKRERNRERTIRQVIGYVKHWRQLHNMVDKYNNKISLQEAAKQVGISKKSLDDYFCQLRLAEQYGFDFGSNSGEKIGILRNFVKQHRPKGDISLKHERLPKKLRIIEDMGAQTTVPRRVSEQKLQDEKVKMQDEIVPSTLQVQNEPSLAVIPEEECQNMFYQSFNFMFDDPQDPLTRSNSGMNLEAEQFLFI